MVIMRVGIPQGRPHCKPRRFLRNLYRTLKGYAQLQNLSGTTCGTGSANFAEPTFCNYADGFRKTFRKTFRKGFHKGFRKGFRKRFHKGF